jgi:hypothetical protein
MRTAATPLLPLSVESRMGAWAPAMQLLNTLADTAAASGVVVKFVRTPA